MIRYDWQVLRKRPISLILNTLYILSLPKKDMKKFPKNILETVSRFRDPSAFLINEQDLVLNKNQYTDSELFVYLELAALRSYINYTQTGNARLPIYYIQGKNSLKYDIEKLKLNTLLTVTEDEIIFKYEET